MPCTRRLASCARPAGRNRSAPARPAPAEHRRQPQGAWIDRMPSGLVCEATGQQQCTSVSCSWPGSMYELKRPSNRFSPPSRTAAPQSAVAAPARGQPAAAPAHAAGPHAASAARRKGGAGQAVRGCWELHCWWACRNRGMQCLRPPAVHQEQRLARENANNNHPPSLLHPPADTCLAGPAAAPD